MHSVKELEVSTRLTLTSDKDYIKGDNSEIIATDSQKNTVYVLAKKHGVKSPEDFAILLCKHFLSTYSHVTRAVVNVKDVMWSRISYGEHANYQKLHNHAFIHTPICNRFATVTLNRGGKSETLLRFSFNFFSMQKKIRQFSAESTACEYSRQLRVHSLTLSLMLIVRCQIRKIEFSGRNEN